MHVAAGPITISGFKWARRSCGVADAFIHEGMILDRRAIDRQRIQNEFLNAFQLRSFIGFEFVPGEIGGCVERGTAEVEDWEISELERASHHLTRIGAIASARGAMFAQGIEIGSRSPAGGRHPARPARADRQHERARRFDPRPAVSHPVGAAHAARHRDGRAPSDACCRASAPQVTHMRLARTRRSAFVARTGRPSCPRRTPSRASDRRLHARAHPALAHSASGGGL